MTKLRTACAAAALAAMATGTALAETTANVGIMSDYVFRGVLQSEATAFAGIDVETESGFYIGTWGANVEDGLEYDVYLGYAGGGENVSWYTGLTGYFYTDGYDGTYKEVNAGFSVGFLSFDYALGEYHYNSANFASPAWDSRLAQYDATWSDTQTYQYFGATFAPEVGPYYFIGRNDFKNIAVDRSVVNYDAATGRANNTGKSGYWYAIGKSFEVVEDLELNVEGMFSTDVALPGDITNSAVSFSSDGTSEFTVVVTLTKTIRTSR